MQPRWIERRASVLSSAGILAAAVLASSCVDDAPPVFAVQGTATGVFGPVTLALHIGGETESLAVTQDGTFAFETRLEDGDSYTVDLVDPDVPCTLRNQTGAIAGADSAIELTCTGASLASVVVSGIVPTVPLMLSTTDYVIDLPLSQSSVTLTASLAMLGDTLTVAGAPVASGTPSTEITLSLGDNPVDIVVENDLGWQRIYRLTLRRAVQLAEYAYNQGSNTGGNDDFGSSVALAGDTLAVGAPGEASAATGVGGDQDNDSAPNSGAVYVFRRAGAAWQQEAYLKASNTGAGDYFGNVVRLSGDTLVVGAPLEASAATGVGGDQADDSAPGSGAVYVFRRTGTTWQQEAYVKASNTGAENFGDHFGSSVALSGDTFAVGAPQEGSAATGVDGDQADNSAPRSGAVYVFRRTGTAWQQEAYVKASNTEANDGFGGSVALSGDTLAVGATGEASSGAVYVFRHTGTAWQQEALLKASNTGEGDLFGVSVALSGDTLAVGASGEASATTGVGGDQADNSAPRSGAVYVFRSTGTTWQQEAYVKASNTGEGDFFGIGVALSGDTLAVTSDSEDSAATGVNGNQDDESSEQSGAAYVFRRTGTTWQQEAYLKASRDGVSFGRSVALSDDTIAIGEIFRFAGDVAEGGVYVFH